MKKFLMFSVIAILTLCNYSCSSEDDYDSSQERVEQLHAFAEKMAAKYGIQISIDDAQLKQDPNISKEQLETAIKYLASLKGTYVGVPNDSNGSFNLYKVIPDSAISTRCDEWKGTASTSLYVDKYSYMTIKFEYCYSEVGVSYVNCTDITFRREPTNYNYNGIILSNLYSYIRDHYFEYEAEVSYSASNLESTYVIYCKYDNNQLKCNVKDTCYQQLAHK